ncbi:MAG: hypothetical protein ACOCVV_02995, partial [Marinobacter sp.]
SHVAVILPADEAVFTQPPLTGFSHIGSGEQARMSACGSNIAARSADRRCRLKTPLPKQEKPAISWLFLKW